jgi:hypothetical protein
MQVPTPSWGEAVEGVQLRVTVAPPTPNAPPPRTVDLPGLQVHIRNNGPAVRTFNLMDFLTASVQVDGIPYRTVVAGSCCPRSEEIEPGGERGPFVLRYPNGLHTADGQPLFVTAGRHTIRLVSSVGGNWPWQPTAGSVSVASNLLAVDIPAVDAAVERQALLDEAVRLGNASLPFVTLVEKYPEAALAAVQQMLLRNPGGPTTRATLISWLFRIPGEEVLTFFRSQLGPDTDMASRSAAAWNLFRRRDPAGLSAALVAWREMQATTLSRATLPNRSAALEDLHTGTGTAAGGLITILANSADVTALQALARDFQQMPLEVRMSAVGIFLRPETGFINVRLNGGPVTLPEGESGRAIQQLLVMALDDAEPIIGKRGTFNDQLYVDPRVSDLAAIVLATRWPARFSFRWSSDESERDAQIARMRMASRAEPAR